MPSPPRRHPGDIRRSPGSGAHTLLLARTKSLRSSATTWIEHELGAGSKVFVKGWLEQGKRPHDHWMIIEGTDRASSAVSASEAYATGQLEFVDYPTVIDRAGGTTRGLFRLQRREIEHALVTGWPSVAMTQESTLRPMVDDAEAAEFAAQERGYDVLAGRWPLNTLCQLSLSDEAAPAVWESVAVHHEELVADDWATYTEGGRWYLIGDLDVTGAREFGAAVYGALRRARDDLDHPDLEADLGLVRFMDLACAQIMLLAARSAAGRQRLILHRVPELVREVLMTVGRPRSVVFDDELDR